MIGTGMEVSDWIAASALGVAFLGLMVAFLTFLYNRRALERERSDRAEQIGLLRQQVSHESAARLIVEHLDGTDEGAEAFFSFTVRNVGRAAARNVRLEVEQPHAKRLDVGWTTAETELRAALVPGGEERASLRVSAEAARKGELLLVAHWEDENGVHQQDLEWLRL